MTASDAHERTNSMLARISTLFVLGAAALAAQPTFTKDIAPIFQRSCQNCHRDGSIAPMSLLNYKESRPWARSIKEKVVRRQMPPWHIDRNVGVTKFKDDPSLSEAEVATIVNWVDHGAPEGNAADMPPPRQFVALDKWHIKPDLIVSMPKPHILKAHGQDEYYDVDVDPGFTEDMYVSALETKPDIGFKVVHHADTNLVEDPEDDPVGLFLNEYAVGKNADIFPANAGRLIKAGIEDSFQSAPAPRWRRDARECVAGIEAVSKRSDAEVRRVHAAHGRRGCGSGYPRWLDHAQRRIFSAAAAGGAVGVSAAFPHSR